MLLTKLSFNPYSNGSGLLRKAGFLMHHYHRLVSILILMEVVY